MFVTSRQAHWSVTELSFKIADKINLISYVIVKDTCLP